MFVIATGLSYYFTKTAIDTMLASKHIDTMLDSSVPIKLYFLKRRGGGDYSFPSALENSREYS